MAATLSHSTASFFESVDPQALLLMGGCKDQVVNHAHVGAFSDKSHRDGEIRDFRALLRGHNDRINNFDRCYCDTEIDAIIALVVKDCAFDTVCERSRMTGRWEHDLDFTFERGCSDRSYQVHRIFGKSFPLDPSRSHYMISRLVTVPWVTVRVGGNSNDMEIPEVLKASVHMVNGSVLIEEQSFRVDRDTDYLLAFEHISKAVLACADGQKSTDQIIEGLRFPENQNESEVYYQLRVLTGRMRQDNTHRSLASDLRKILSRMWDAIVVVRTLKPKLETRLQELGDEQDGTAMPGFVLDEFRRAIRSTGETLELADQKRMSLIAGNFQEDFERALTYERRVLARASAAIGCADPDLLAGMIGTNVGDIKDCLDDKELSAGSLDAFGLFDFFLYRLERIAKPGKLYELLNRSSKVLSGKNLLQVVLSGHIKDVVEAYERNLRFQE